MNIVCKTIIILLFSFNGYATEYKSQYLYHAINNQLCEACIERDCILRHGITKKIEENRYYVLEGKIQAYETCLKFMSYDAELTESNIY